ncbi:hypothetical protein VUR80DRAFT_2581 [Thermomyces stellatus]
MGLRDILKKKEQASEAPGPVPEFTFVRTDTLHQEVLHDPSAAPPAPGLSTQHLSPATENKSRRSLDVFRPRSRSRSGSASSGHRRSMLHRREPTSENLPADLPQIENGEGHDDEWEARAMMLARSRPGSAQGAPPTERAPANVDEDIQEAIRLHEEGNLEASTRLFGRLADPKGANNSLSQVLYGLALRHGWGCRADVDAAVHYLSKAASNSAAVEQMALQAGLKKGGGAKGELVLAIFELANCFRHGWGIKKDPVAAKQYYETAANLGDTDAMNEVAWCYLEGFGCKKDKYAAARYYRLAEKNGNKTLGNSWIWKEKYGPPEEPSTGKK